MINKHTSDNNMVSPMAAGQQQTAVQQQMRDDVTRQSLRNILSRKQDHQTKGSHLSNLQKNKEKRAGGKKTKGVSYGGPGTGNPNANDSLKLLSAAQAN